jgi:Domain of unknown function (DUF4381)
MTPSLPNQWIRSVTWLLAAAISPALVHAQAPAPKNDGLRDIAPPVPPTIIESMDREDWWWLAASLALFAAAVYFAWFFFIRKRPAAPVAPPDPRDVARASLLALRQRTEELSPRDFGAEASGVLRRFIRRRYGISTMRRTSEEFLSAIARDRVFSPLEGELLGRFLTQCDALKFANLDSSQAEALRLIDDALAFVEQAPDPQPPPLPKS